MFVPSSMYPFTSMCHLKLSLFLPILGTQFAIQCIWGLNCSQVSSKTNKVGDIYGNRQDTVSNFLLSFFYRRGSVQEGFVVTGGIVLVHLSGLYLWILMMRRIGETFGVWKDVWVYQYIATDHW